jgi:putative YphP/YqiW family bacilliredoxin
MFPEIMVVPMREDLTRIGFRELRTPADVDAALKNERRTTLVVVNSVWGARLERRARRSPRRCAIPPVRKC